MTPEVTDSVRRAGGPTTGIPDWNCLEVEFLQRALSCITANDQSGVGERISELLATTKVVASYLTTQAPGPVLDAYVGGELSGIEFRFMKEAPWTDPPAALLVADLVDASGDVLATAYAYNSQQYTDRKVQVMAEMGAQFTLYPVWAGWTLGTSGSGALQIAGWENELYGSVYATGLLRLGGDENSISGALLYTSGAMISGTDHEFGSITKVGKATLPVPSASAATYRSLALQANQFFPGDLNIYLGPGQAPVTEAGVPLQGVVYSEGVIIVEDSAIVGSLTLVAENGAEVLGNNCQLSAATDDLLFWVVNSGSSNLLSISGSANSFSGAMFAGNKVEVTGSYDLFFGPAYGSTLRLVGSHTLWNDGTYVP